MSFDPSKPFEVEGASGFDPSKPFEIEAHSKFDPSKSFEVENSESLYEKAVGGIKSAIEGLASQFELVDPYAPKPQNTRYLEQTMGALARGDIAGAAKGAEAIAPTAARVGIPLAAAVAAPMTGGGSIAATMPFLATGGALGEATARVIEGGQAMNPTEIGVAAAGGMTMVPAAPGATALQRTIGGALEGGALATGSAAAQGRPIGIEEAAIGAGIGVAGRLAEGLATGAPKQSQEVAKEVPLEPASVSIADDAAKAAELSEAKRIQLSQDFELARLEEAKQRQMLALDARKGSEPVMGMPKTPVATPKSIIGIDDIDEGPQLSTQARRMQEEYGRIDPRLVLAMARGGVGAAIGSYIGDTPEEKVMYGIAGAAAGVAASKTMANMVSRQLSNMPVDKVKAKVVSILATHRALGREIAKEIDLSQASERAYYQKSRQIADDLTDAIKKSPNSAKVESEMAAYMRGDAPASAISDPNVRFYSELDRQMVDDISNRAIAEGAVVGKMKDTFTDNLGRYLYRGYRVFMDEGYAPSAKVHANAVNWIQNNWEKGRVLPLSEAQGIANSLINPATAPEFMTGASKIGGKDISVLIRRKEIAPEIRELMGEITNPIDQVLLGIPHMAKLVEGNALQKRIRDVGLNTGIFSTTRTPTHYATLVSDTAKPTTSSYPSYKGLYMAPEVRDAMMSISESGKLNSITDVLWNVYKSWNAASKITKTVFNPESYMPNFYGGGIMAAMNGHVPFRYAKDAAMLSASDMGLLRMTGMLPADRQAFADLSNKLTALGVRNDNLTRNDLALAFHKTVFDKIKDTKAFKLPFATYGQTDDLWKTIAWSSERSQYARAYPNAASDELDRLAASRVIDTMPTFSKVPKAMREASAFGIMPSFISFTEEVFRNTYNATRIAIQDIKEGMATGNSALTSIGAKRLVGVTLATTAASGVGVAAWSAISNQIGPDRERAIKDLGPTWNRNSPLLYLTGIGEDGRVRVMNLSYIMPQAVTTQAITAAIKGQDWQDALVDAASDQWFGGGVLTQPIVSALTGKTQSGRPIRDVQHTPSTQAKETALYLADETLRPGVANTIKRGLMAVTGEEGPGGQVWTPTDVALRLAGVRSQTLDLHKAFKFKLGKLSGEIRDAQHKYTSLKDRNLDAKKMEEAYVDSEASRRSAWEKARNTFNHYKSINLSEERAIKLAREAGLSSETILGFVENSYTPQKVMNAGKDALMASIATMGKNDVKRLIASADAITAPKIIGKFMEVAREKKLNLSEHDKLVRSLDAESQLDYINKKLGQMQNPSERRAYLEDYRRRGILHEQVLKDIRDQARQSP